MNRKIEKPKSSMKRVNKKVEVKKKSSRDLKKAFYETMLMLNGMYTNIFYSHCLYTIAFVVKRGEKTKPVSSKSPYIISGATETNIINDMFLIFLDTKISSEEREKVDDILSEHRGFGIPIYPIKGISEIGRLIGEISNDE